MKTWKIAVLLSYISVASASAAIITPALPQIQQSLRLDHGHLEWIVSIFLIGYMLGQIIYGPLANRIGRLNALRTGFIINLVGIVICLLASFEQSYWGLLAGRLITSLGAAAGLSCTFILLNESLSMERAKHAISFAIVSFTAGIGLAVLCGGMVTHYLQWQDCFWILLLHGVIILFSTWLFNETLITKQKISVSTLCQQYVQALLHRKLFVFSLFVGLVSVFSYCFSAAAPLIAQHLRHLSAAGYGYWNMLNMLGMLCGAVLAAKILQRFHGLPILMISTLLLIVGMLVLAILAYCHSLNAINFFMITALIYFVASFIFPAASHMASNAISDKANAAGAMNFINMGSAVLSVVVMGYLPINALSAFISVNVIFAIICVIAFLTSGR